MKQARNFPAATITKKAENSLRLGHPWVYDAEVLNLEGEPENGSLVDVFSEKGFLSRHRLYKLQEQNTYTPPFLKRKRDLRR